MTRIYDNNDFNDYYNPQYQGRNSHHLESDFEERVDKLNFMSKYIYGCLKYFRSFIQILIVIIIFMIFQSTNFIDGFVPQLPYTNIILFNSCQLNKTIFLSLILSFILVSFS